MRHLKITMLMVLSLALTMFLGLAGCDDDHRTRFHNDRDRNYERHDVERHGDRDRDSVYDREHRDR